MISSKPMKSRICTLRAASKRARTSVQCEERPQGSPERNVSRLWAAPEHADSQSRGVKAAPLWRRFARRLDSPGPGRRERAAGFLTWP
eukprot:7389433-Prymnesium_polylepis.2